MTGRKRLVVVFSHFVEFTITDASEYLYIMFMSSLDYVTEHTSFSLNTNLADISNSVSYKNFIYV